MNGSVRQRLEAALEYAALAPKEIDWDAWEFRLADEHLELIAESAPELEGIDPDGRESMISCGAALQYLKLALKHSGSLGRVELFPELDQPRLVARIHSGNSSLRDRQESLIFEAMSRSLIPSSSMGKAPVSDAMLAVLSQAVAGERGWLDFTQSETSLQRVVKITLAADDGRSQWTSPWSGRQASRWSRPLLGFGSRSVKVRKAVVEQVRQLPTPAATLAVVKTKTDDKHGWLAAGQTMARAILQAQAMGLSWAFVDPLRRQAAREELRVIVGHKGFAQVILRFGSLMADLPATAGSTAARIASR